MVCYSVKRLWNDLNYKPSTSEIWRIGAFVLYEMPLLNILYYKSQLIIPYPKIEAVLFRGDS